MRDVLAVLPTDQKTQLRIALIVYPLAGVIQNKLKEIRSLHGHYFFKLKYSFYIPLIDA